MGFARRKSQPEDPETASPEQTLAAAEAQRRRYGPRSNYRPHVRSRHRLQPSNRRSVLCGGGKGVVAKATGMGQRTPDAKQVSRSHA
jgi:hypothetical protein